MAEAKRFRESKETLVKDFIAENKKGWVAVRPSRRARRGANGLRYSLEETFPATEAERAEIERSAKANGTWLKAPNGQDTKLTPKQWVTVRTRAFKEWFGDWEKDARIEKLRRSEPLVFTGEEYKGKYELDARSAERYILDNLRGEYVNKDTGERISVSRRGVRKVLHHDVENEVHLKSIAYIPQMLENAVFVSEELNAKSTTGFDSYRYYVCGLEIGGEQYTAKLVVGKLGRETYYDHVLSPIKKDTLLKGIGEIPSPRAQKKSISTEIRDKRLLSILQTNSSKIVDENGEPLVVWHGTREHFYEFEHGRAIGSGDIYGYLGDAFYATNDYETAESYADGGYKRTLGLFLNIRNPYETKNPDHTSPAHGGSFAKHLGVSPREVSPTLRQMGHDGVIATDEEAGYIEYAFYHSTQAKSATENVGTFDAGNPDIRYALGHGYMRDGRWSANAEEAMSEGRFPAKHIAWLLDISPEVVENTLPWEGEFHHMGEDFKKVHFYSMPNAAERIMLKYFVPRIRGKNDGGTQSFNNHRDKVARQFGVYDYVGIAKQRMSAEEEAALDLEAFEKAYAEAAEKDRAERDAEMREMWEKYGVEMEEVPQPLDYDYEYGFHDDEGMIRYSLGGGTSTIRAWHGSPHAFAAEEGAPFGRFNLGFVGKGEGAQAFGYGIYLTSEEDIARHNYA